ncbi:glycosyltransferase [Paenibacillus elgii]|uniref:glycosyltransferase n=1 Tax=Paenibacillus elgii TaxID=189691 RepID=UPI000248CEB3|nr:glycosyltransferase [Paenibacillus elgii]
MKFSGERFIPNATDRDMAVEHLQRYFAITELVQDKVVMDAAFGEGYGSFILSDYAKSIIGVDISAEAIVHAQLTYAKSNVTFVQGSIEQLPVEDQSVDVVVSFETIEHVDETIQHQFLKEIKRVLKPDGILVMSTPDKYVYSDRVNYHNSFHVREFYKEEFYSFLKEYFNNIDMYYQKHEVSSLIVNNRTDRAKRIHIEQNDHVTNGKYLIAVCSNESLADCDLNSFVPDHQEQHYQMIQRILSLQDEVEERNQHIKHLDEAIVDKDRHIDQANNKLSFVHEQLTHQNSTVNQALNIVNSMESQLKENSEKLLDALLKAASQEEQLHKLQEELKAKEEIIESMNYLHHELNSQYEEQSVAIGSGILEKDQTINNQIAHINMLLEQERKLNNILHSGGWRALSKYYRLRDTILPDNSKRKLLAKLTYKALKNPKQILSKVNKNNIKKLKYYLNTEDPSLIESRIDNFLDRHAIVEHSVALKLYQEIDTSQKLVFPVTKNPLVSIIIPVYNQWHYTYACLKSILDHTNDVSYEIIIADDMSTDETVNAQQYVQNVKIVRDGTNRGFLLNCNNASKYAEGKYIFFLNNDTNVQPEWLGSLVGLIERDETIGMVGSKLVYPDGRQQEAGGIIWNDASGWNYGRLDDPSKSEYNYVKEVDYISGAAIMIRHELWKVIGGFDERYVPAYYEDTDLAFEIRKQGYKVVFQPQSVIVHFEGISHGKDESTGIKSYQVTNKQKFIDKWKNELRNNHFENAEHVFLARDRTKNKTTIVVVDHYVPHYDKDAGGRCTYHYLKLFVELGFHVIFIGDNFFKHEPYTSELQQLGIEVLYGDWYYNNIENWIKNNAQYFDYIYLNRPHISIKYIDIFIKYTKAKIIYFGHDLHYLRELRNYEVEINPEILKSSEYWKKVEFGLFEKADVIHVVGNYEQQILEKELPNKPIRNIPLYIFDKCSEDIRLFNQRKNLLFVGGFNHKPNYDGVKWFVNDIFPKIIKQLPDIIFYIVGSNPPEEILQLSSKNIIVVGYVTDEQLKKYYSEAKIVVVPLRFGAGVKGKVVEALYNQVPVVTTTIGAEGLANIKDCVIVENNDEQFANKVVNLYNNEEFWNELSTNSRKNIIENFSKKAAASILKLDFIKGDHT